MLENIKTLWDILVKVSLENKNVTISSALSNSLMFIGLFFIILPLNEQNVLIQVVMSFFSFIFFVCFLLCFLCLIISIKYKKKPKL